MADFPMSPAAEAGASGPGGNPLRALTLDQLRRRTSSKWRAYPPDVLPLWVAEMDVPLPGPVVRALTEAIALGDTGYATGEEYTRALGGFARRRWGWDGVVPGRTALVPDVMHGVVEMLRLVTDPGDAVVVNPPVYPPFFGALRHAGRRIVEAPLNAAGRIDPTAVEGAFAKAVAGGRRAACLLCSPHNPTGAVHSRAELAAVAEPAAAYGVRMVVDEIHAPLVRPGTRFVPYLSVPGTEGAFALLSASKAWHLAGAKAALAVAGAGAADELARLPSMVGEGASHLGVIAHVAALRHGEPWLDALLAGIDGNRRLLGELLDRYLPDVRYVPPEGTYLAWLDCRALGLGDDPAAVFLERGRVALSSGIPFGTGGAGHVRLNLAASPEVITEAVRRMAKAVG
ncbi:MalY/PatB family protein [Streptomyces gamaensis]|uniref:cysteine-S-conjugate beta-lyase n=1 Tax=Streptomyces gamaensis TaxID=1763542 RepID=A0ABW0Z545_9ACTN